MRNNRLPIQSGNVFAASCSDEEGSVIFVNVLTVCEIPFGLASVFHTCFKDDALLVRRQNSEWTALNRINIGIEYEKVSYFRFSLQTVVWFLHLLGVFHFRIVDTVGDLQFTRPAHGVATSENSQMRIRLRLLETDVVVVRSHQINHVIL